MFKIKLCQYNLLLIVTAIWLLWSMERRGVW